MGRSIRVGGQSVSWCKTETFWSVLNFKFLRQRWWANKCGQIAGHKFKVAFDLHLHILQGARWILWETKPLDNLQQETHKQPSQLYKLYQLIILNWILGSLLFANLAHADVHHRKFANLRVRADLARWMHSLFQSFLAKLNMVDQMHACLVQVTLGSLGHRPCLWRISFRVSLM